MFRVRHSAHRTTARGWPILLVAFVVFILLADASSSRRALSSGSSAPDVHPEKHSEVSAQSRQAQKTGHYSETSLAIASQANLAPVADAYVSSTATTTNFGAATELRSKRLTLESYLKFDLFSLSPDETILSAKLRLMGQLSDTSGTNVTAQVFSVSSTSWTEAAITWSNKPTSGTTALASVQVTDNLARLYEWDVTSFVKAEVNAERHLISLALKNPSTSSPHATFNSREAFSNPPELVLTTTVPPTASITSPANGTSFLTPSTITIDGEASDGDGIMKVEFLRGSTLLGTDNTFPYSFTWANAPVGNYALTARATDNLGAITTSNPVNVSVVATLPPTVSITSPTSGTTFQHPATISITADASDTDGISKVDFYQGSTLLGTVTTVPYSFTWTGMPACTFVLTAKVTDNLGATATSSPVTVKVTGGTIGEATPPNFKVAFLADQGLGPLSVAALNLVVSEGAQALVIAGDLDYDDNPAAWEAQLNSTVGPNFPVFTVAGNHDEDVWHGPTGYQKVIEARFNRLGIPWCGSCGVQSSFHYKGIFFVQTTPGLDPIVDLGNNDTFIREQLAADHSVWSVSSWHKNMRLMQAGGKSDETGWEVYEESRAGGAIIANGHEHSYFRTHLLSSMMNQTVASTSNVLTLTKGNSFVFVSGLGGDSRRDQEITGPWVAKIYATPCLPGDPVCQPNAVEGATFGVFNVEGQQNKANFYFKNVNGQIIDSFTVISEVDMPTITGISPSEVASGGNEFTLTIDGANFLNEAVVLVNGSALPTTFVSSAQLTAQVSAAVILSGGTFPVTVFNGGTGGGNSSPVNLAVTSPVPSIATLSPTAAIRGGGDFTLTVNGSNFVGNSYVRFNGIDQLTSFVSTTQLTALITASGIPTAGTFPVTVINPAPGGGSSNAADFSVSNPAPALDSISPANTTAGAATFTLTVNGANFLDDSVVRVNGSDRATTFVSATQLSAQILATDIQAVGTFAITVRNPIPGGGTSTAVDFTVNNPAPTIGSLVPASANAGKAAFTLTVNGADFVNGAVVKWNDSDRPTNFVSSTQLVAQMSAADVASAGTFPITVVNPPPGGGVSSSIDFTVNNPVPAVNNLSPASAAAGSPSLSLTVNGSNFGNGSVVRLEGQERATSFVSPAQLTAEITAADLQGAGTFHLTVFNPAPGGGLSNAIDFLVGGPNPVPTISALSPANVTTGEAAFTLTVGGTKFVSGSVVRFDGNDRATSFVSSTQLTAQITAADIASGGTFPITVFNPAEGGGTSNAVNLNVNNPPPSISNLSPSNTGAGGADFTITVTGSNFISGSVLKWNGSDRPTSVVSGTQLTAQITAADVASAGTVLITVVSPSPGGGPSNAINFTVNNPTPVLGNISPTSAMSGDLAFTLTLNGNNFANGSVVKFDGNDRATGFVSSTQLTAQITAADLQNAGTFHITVFNPAPGGGASNTIDFLVIGPNPVPVIGVLSPANATVGGAGFTLTVNGMNFVNGSVVSFNSSDRVTSFVSSTELNAQITAADVATAGTFLITVFNPAPGGGPSGAITFNVNNPAPILASISPTNKTAGSGPFTLAVSGSGFISNSVVRFNGGVRPTAFVDSTQLTAQISAADIQNAGAFSVTVFNPAPGGGSTTAINLTVDNPAPALTSLLPTSAIAAGGPFTLTVNGTGFVNTAIVRFNGNNRTTTFTNSTRLTAQITAADLATAGTFPITVLNPSPGGGTSNAINFIVNNPTPSVGSLSPTNALMGSAFILTVNGSNFVSSSVVRFNGNSRVTTFVSATRLTAQISVEDTSTAGTASVTVFNSIPGGGTSNGINFTVNNRAPILDNISPASASAGGTAFSLTVNGSNFVSGSLVRFNGSNRATTFVSATQLTAQILPTDLQIAATFPITVQNPTPGGGASNAVIFTVNNLTPTISTLSPSNIVAAEPAFTLIVNGANFVNGAVVKFNGVSRTTTLVNSTQLRAQILATDIQTAGTPPVTVLNPGPGGGSSAPITFTINNPAPILGTISPATVVVGAAFTLTVNGTNFKSSSVVNLNGLSRATTFVSSTQLTAQILATDVATTGAFSITVFNPAPGGGTSNATDLTVNNPVPSISGLSPASVIVGGVEFTLTVNGTGFVNGSVVSFNGANRTTSFVNPTQLAAQITAADIQAAGAFPITVFNPTPGGGTSASGSFMVNNPVPTLSSINPPSKTAGDAAFILTVNGASFVNGSIVRFNGSDRTTTFVSSSQLNAGITAADISTAGVFTVTVHNPVPGGGTSNAVGFTVIASSVNVFNISPDNAVAGGPGFTLTVTGNNFFDGVTVRWNGSDRPTTVVNPTQLTAQISDTDISQQNYPAPGTALVTVFASGGLISAPFTFTISCACGYEGDVSPRPNGSNTGVLTISDWVQLGRFGAGIDTPNEGCEFQRADIAPRSTLGSGSITISDWVQAGRYAAGIDSPVCAGGPTGPPQGPTSPPTLSSRLTAAETSESFMSGAKAALRLIRLTNTKRPTDRNVRISIDLDAQTGENAIGLSLNFIPGQLTFVSASKGRDAQDGTLVINSDYVATGNLGVALALPTGRSFAPGSRQLVVLNFKSSMRRGLPDIDFGDQPVKRELVDLNARELGAHFIPLVVSGDETSKFFNPIDDPRFFVNQMYRDVLRRVPDTEGLDYWTKQITMCGSDQACLENKRINVSAAFFIEREFKETGFFIYLLYTNSLGRKPTYSEFISERLGAADPSTLETNKARLVADWTMREGFLRLYPLSLSPTEFVNRLFDAAGLEPNAAERQRQIEGMTDYRKTRADVLRDLVETRELKDREYDPAFIRMQYFAYLQRDPDLGGESFWLDVLRTKPVGDQTRYDSMICAFLSSKEYQLRFSSLITRSDATCGP